MYCDHGETVTTGYLEWSGVLESLRDIPEFIGLLTQLFNYCILPRDQKGRHLKLDQNLKIRAIWTMLMLSFYPQLMDSDYAFNQFFMAEL